MMANPVSYNPTYIATATTTTVATGRGVLHAINITETAAGAITVYDNTLGCTIVTAAASKLTVSWGPM